MSESQSDLLTIDLNVARDFLDSRRAGHRAAQELFAFNGAEVELAIGPQGQLLDAPEGNLREELEMMCKQENVRELRQLAYLSEATFPSEDLFPGQYVEGFQDAWRQIIETWKTSDGKAPEHPDDFHVEAHVFEERDAFVTGDRALREMCRRLNEEHDVPISAMKRRRVSGVARSGRLRGWKADIGGKWTVRRRRFLPRRPTRIVAPRPGQSTRTAGRALRP